MEDGRHGIEPNGIIKLPSGESTRRSKSTNNNKNINNNNGKEQDRFLPIANVGRIMKKVIPGNGKISKDAKETVQECVSEFISFITGEASDKCQREKRKTINGDDIIWAITTLGFEDYVSPLKLYLQKYRDLEGEKLNVPKQQQHHHHHPHGGDQQNQPNLQASNFNNCVYSSTSLLPPQPTSHDVPTDQTFPLQFTPNSIQTQLTQHEQMDQWGIGN
ncbi:DNA-binding transcription factor [Lithospermum erythrorhizon]|uniref:DNA-binding transcription factor n=1 Tax=Lithospermum erythrorhizon TaxID=34254 RepID=A0AAV3QG73_LITER